MNFLEWFLESTNPGPVGKLEVDAPEPEDEQPPKKWMIWLGIFFGIVLCELSLKWVFSEPSWRHSSQIIVKLGGLGLYIWASYRLTAKPDTSNVGWLSGLLDNPFRSSDNVNRWLAYLQALLLPGKLMAYSVIMGWFLFQSVYKKPRK